MVVFFALFFSGLAYADCPQTEKAWNEYASFVMDDLRELSMYRFGTESPKTVQAMQNNPKWIASRIAKRLNDCLPTAPLRVQKCLGKSNDFLSDHFNPQPKLGKVYDLDTNGQTKKMALTIPDQEYFNAQNQPWMEYPDELQDSQLMELLPKVDMSSPETADAVISRIAEINFTKGKTYKAIPFVNAFLTSVDKSPSRGRILLHQTKDRYEQFIMYSVKDSTSPGDGHSQTSVVSIVKKDKDGNPIDPPQVYYRDFERRVDSATGKTSVSKEAMMVGRNTQCYLCHSSGALSIHVDNTFNREKFGDSLDAINRIVAQNKTSKNAFQNYNSQGPGLGPVLTEGERPDSFMKGCFPETPDPTKESIAKVRKAMNCASCHDGVRRGKIFKPGPPTPGYNGIVPAFIHTLKSMPPGADLTDIERSALSVCLGAEYWGVRGREGLVSKWMLDAPSCSEIAFDNMLAQMDSMNFPTLAPLEMPKITDTTDKTVVQPVQDSVGETKAGTAQ